MVILAQLVGKIKGKTRISSNIILMYKNSQFYQSQQPQEEAQPSDPQQLKKYWDALKGGWRNPRLKYEDWSQRFLSPQQWMAANPGKTMQEYKQYRTKLRQPRRQNWLQRAVGIDPGYRDIR